MENNYLTVKEVCELLGVSDRTLRSYINEGKLKAYKLGTGWKMKPTDIEIFIQNQSNIKGE